MKKKWFLIANPSAGGFKVRKDFPKIARLLTARGIIFKKNFSKKRLHALSLAKNAVKEGFTHFIAVGGDGTVNEVVNGMLESPNPEKLTLAVIPVGTGNDWGKSTGITNDYQRSVKAIKAGKTLVQDICKASFHTDEGIHERFFINVAGSGYDAEVLFKTEKMKKLGKTGKWLYFRNIFTSLFSYKPTTTIVTIDEKEIIDEKMLSLNVGIGKYNGGGMMQVPHAELDDGSLALTFIGNIGKLGIVAHSNKLKKGMIGNIPKVQLLKGKKIKIKTETPLLFEADGEALGTTPLTFEVVSKALRVICGFDTQT